MNQNFDPQSSQQSNHPSGAVIKMGHPVSEKQTGTSLSNFGKDLRMVTNFFR